ncbi:type III pantothenate kinase [Mucilaginibacter pedocola]|uniref:Type III pantothenate kinase n=1 Tax=Mucilaginibacter pedocola TaxID=1792845 RepID=A0A1S9PC39_9SPHI|nr:type III pantothenate kinase [Mucilaginibacter pedocola]OOQ58543.1 hypothetical protein BC343_07700 [Mucilaginibacter pedocola]
MVALVIDIGNTLTKIAVFNGDEMLEVQQYPEVTRIALAEFCSLYLPDAVIVSTVKNAERHIWEDALAAFTINCSITAFDSSTPTGINNHYKTPKTLGADRLAAVVGAHHLYPNAANIIIGGGTAITYDYVDAGANYFGGSISPGLKMRYKALNQFTGALPLIEVDENFEAAYGDDTASAITSGVQNGIKYELTGFINEYIKTQQAYNIILSGGDSIFFDTLLKNSIFAPYIKIEPYLVLKGLNAAIQKHND